VVTTGRRSAKILRAGSREVLAVLAGIPSDVLGAAFSHDGELVVTAGSDGAARIWDSHSGDLVALVEQSDRDLQSAVFSPDDRRVLTAGADASAIAWDLPFFNGSLAELSRVVRCRVPYRVEGGRAAARPLDPSACVAP